MNQTHIVVFGLRFPVSQGTLKVFLCVWLPLVLGVSLFNGYLVADALSRAFDVGLGWVIAALVVLTVKFTYNKADGSTGSLVMLKSSALRALVGFSLLGYALYFYASVQEVAYVYSLAATAVLVLVSRAGAAWQRRRDRVSEQARAAAEILNPQVVSDVPYREVRR